MATATHAFNNNIHLELRKLLEKKTKRDKKNFTIYQLAKAIDVPHSILVKLMHVDPEKRVNNPRIDTLSKIIDFFRKDGFDIAIDDLLLGVKKSIDVDSQPISLDAETKEIPVYQMGRSLQKNIGYIKTKLSSKNGNYIALSSNEDIEPIFKRGSLFIIDTLATPENDNLVAVSISDENSILIKKLVIKKNKRMLTSFDQTTSPIEISSKTKCQFIGVVIQVNAKT